MNSFRATMIVGCTACGKGSLGRELARRTGGEIVSLDSMKIYRRMDIGTAKPSISDRRTIPHHLIDAAEPSEEFSVARYVELSSRAIADITRRGKPIFVVGGTILYLKALTEGLFEGPGADATVRARLHERAESEGSSGLHRELQIVDPGAAERIHPNDLKRIVRALEVYELTGQPISALQSQWNRNDAADTFMILGLRREKEDQSRRINQRVHRMIEAGWVEEVQLLLDEPTPLSATARKATGYGEIIEHLAGRMSLEEAVESTKITTRRFAKSQRTWLRRIRGIEWYELSESDTDADIADRLTADRGATWSR